MNDGLPDFEIPPRSHIEGISPANLKLLVGYLTYRQNTKKKAPKTVSNECSLLLNFLRFSGARDVKKLSRKDMESFFANISIENKDLYGTKIIQFYNHILELKRKQRPANMEWFEHRTKAEKVKKVDPQALEKYFISAEHYQAIQRVTINNQDKALWETMYLSGARPSEICSMTVGSVVEGSEGIKITVWDSKTVPRNIPMPEYPKYLMQWKETHPDKDDKKAKMWFTQSRRDYGKPINGNSIVFKLTHACKLANIPRHKPHDFRKTRATIMFDKGYDDTMMAYIFGWQVELVSERRRQYDVRTEKELDYKIFNGTSKPETVAELKQERDVKIRQLEKQIEELKREQEKREEMISRMVDKQLTAMAEGRYKPRWVEQKVKEEKD